MKCSVAFKKFSKAAYGYCESDEPLYCEGSGRKHFMLSKSSQFLLGCFFSSNRSRKFISQRYSLPVITSHTFLLMSAVLLT